MNDPDGEFFCIGNPVMMVDVCIRDHAGSQIPLSSGLAYAGAWGLLTAKCMWNVALGCWGYIV